MHKRFCWSVKQNSGTASMGTGSLWSEQNACFTRVTQVARCQSQHQCHFWRINSMFEAYCTDQWAWQLSINVLTLCTRYRYLCICINASYKIAHADTGSRASGNKLGLSNHLILYSIGTASANSMESDLGSTSRIFFDYVTLTLHNDTLTSQKPCQHNNKCDCSKTIGYIWSLWFINKILQSRYFIEKS